MKRPCAFVTLKPDGAASAEDIIAFCRANMAHFKVPKTMVFGPLPKTSTGKIQKFILRDTAKNIALTRFSILAYRRGSAGMSGSSFSGWSLRL